MNKAVSDKSLRNIRGLREGRDKDAKPAYRCDNCHRMRYTQCGCKIRAK